jgi:ABC-type Na+ efflux pump permease subunit
MRAVYASFLFLLMCTAWWILAGTQLIRSIGDMARFGGVLFQILAPLQLALILFMSAIQAASNIAVEKDRQTFILLLMTRMNNSELVLGKLSASLLNIAVLLLTSLPIFMLIVLLGGSSFQQVGWTYAVTALTGLAAGSLGSTIALWREKTFQTLALSALALVFWTGLFEGLAVAGGGFGGSGLEQIAMAASPIRAIFAASSPTVSQNWLSTVVPYLGVAGVVIVVLNGLAMWRVRKWNPSRDIRPGQVSSLTEQKSGESLFVGGNADGSGKRTHVDDRSRIASQKSRRVWDNPVLWREACTWAYGKKILFIRVAYWLLAAGVALWLVNLARADALLTVESETAIQIAPAIRPVAPFVLVSLVILNALAVTSITNERDGRSLDLLWMTDLSPKEFLFGKLGGVLFVAADVILLPMAMFVFLFANGAVSLENFLYVLVGMAIIIVFIAILGLHCGMIYANSRQAIGVSLGTVFFLFVGVITSMVMMVSFTGNVEAQLPPFIACMVGGSIGLYSALGLRNRSPAIGLASGILPLAMFVSITSFLLERFLTVFLVVGFAYGFATTAMIIPALSEFHFAMARVKSAEHD